MPLRPIRTDPQPLRDLRIRQPLSHQLKHLELPRRQDIRMLRPPAFSHAPSLANNAPIYTTRRRSHSPQSVRIPPIGPRRPRWSRVRLNQQKGQSMAAEHSYLKTHQLSGTGLITDALDEAVDLLERARASASGRAAKTLVKNGPLRITLIAMRKGAAAKRHHVEGPATIQIMRGRLRITTPRGPEDLPVRNPVRPRCRGRALA